MPPAARITDLHTCPAHAGGPIVTGFPTVIIGHKPAARVSDKAVCAGPADAVAVGSATVIIGHQQAARMGDPTNHGGVVATGFPTVIIGVTAQGATLSGAGGAPFCAECERARREAEERAKRERGEQQEEAAPAPEAEEPEESAPPADEPTETEVAQASAPGNTLEQRAAREKVVRDFYAKSGLGSARADVDLGVGGLPPRANRHPLGFRIDVTKPLQIVALPEVLAQAVPRSGLPGLVFSPVGASLGEALGPGTVTAGSAAAALLPKIEGLTKFAMPAGMGLLSTSGPGAGRVAGLPQVTVPDAVRRLVQPVR